jgi:xanthine permease XanP
MTSVPDRPERPSNLVYAVDEWPPPLRLVLLGFQYAVMAAIYLILVVIILRHAKAAQGTGVDAMGIACVGLAIGTALQALPRGPVGSGFLAPPAFPFHLTVTTLTLMVCVGLSIWGRGTLKLLCSSLGLIAGMAAASVIGLIDPEKLTTFGQAPYLALPRPAFMQVWFDAGLVPAFLASGVAASLRAVGVITTCQRINNAAWRRPDRANIRKGVLADGLSNVVGGALGVPGMSAGPSLVGVSGATGATSRAIGFAASIVLLVFAFSPKLSGFTLQQLIV